MVWRRGVLPFSGYFRRGRAERDNEGERSTEGASGGSFRSKHGHATKGLSRGPMIFPIPG